MMEVPQTKKGAVSVLVLVGLACCLMIEAPQFLVNDWRRQTLKQIAKDDLSQLQADYEEAASANVDSSTVINKVEDHVEAAGGEEVRSNHATGSDGDESHQLTPEEYSKSRMQLISSIKGPDMTGKINILWNGLDDLNSMMNRFWSGNKFCETIQEARQTSGNPQLAVTFNITFGCGELFEKSELGTGNFISGLYAMRMATQVFDNVDFHFECHDAFAQKNSLILPWMTGWFPSRNIRPTQSNLTGLTERWACGNYGKAPVAFMYREIQYDLRRMAVGLVGIPSPDHPSAKFAEEYLYSNTDKFDQSSSILQLPAPAKDDRPPFPGTDFKLDDAVIHFRCGDLMVSNHPSFGFMKFSGYTKYISPEAKSIGILTQPFDSGTQTRKGDSSSTKRQRCKAAVLSLVDYIKERFPTTEVNIHNGPSETIALAYARMVMANQTIVGISSFGVFPVVASFGTGYVRKPDFRKAPNAWLLKPDIQQLADNVVLIDEPKRIMAGRIKGMWEKSGVEGVLEWFWDDNVK